MKKIILTLGIVVLLVVAYLVADSLLFDGVKPKVISENDIQAKYYSSDTTTQQPAIILVGGGQWGDYWGQEFAKKGYVGLSLPYHRREGLPQLPEEIPLEYFEKALSWLGNQPEVNPNKIMVMGASRNAELSLVIASTLPALVHGVIAYAPSAVSWSNTVLPYNSDELKPSWTYRGEPIPYIAMEKLKGGTSSSLETLDYWKAGLSDGTDVAMASIKVENINGPILLLSGKDDRVWPSAQMSDMIESRIEQTNFNFDFQNIQYENCGHMISGNPNSISTERNGQFMIDEKSYIFPLGGTPEGDQKAQLDAKEKVFEFLMNY